MNGVPTDPRRVALVITAYNEAAALGEVLREATAAGYRTVVVDDGSTDGTAQVAASWPVHLIRHPINLGAGAAVQTGVQYAARLPVEAVATIDGDGQHPVADVARLVEPILAGRAEVVFGSRFLDVPPEGLPPLRRRMLRLAVAFTRLTTGLAVTDTHNGMRAFSAAVAQRLDLQQNGYAYCSELLHWTARERLRWCEAPVRVRYTDYSLRKGQSIWNFFNILWDLWMG